MRKITALTFLALSLSLTLTGCGDDTQISRGVDQIKVADNSVAELNKLTEQSEELSDLISDQ